MKRLLQTAVFTLLFAGAGLAVEPQRALNAKAVRELVANAKTAADHQKLANHYSAMADKHDAEAAEHEALAAQYRGNPGPSSAKRPMAPDTAEHCDYFAHHCRNAAKEMRALADAHRETAKRLR